MRRFVAVDLETTGLDSDQDQIIEVGLAGEHPDGDYFEQTYTLPFHEDYAHPEALAVNGWGKRPFPAMWTEYESVAFLAHVLNDVHIVGKNPQFDVGFLKVEFAVQDVATVWHHRLVDVGPLAWGWKSAHDQAYGEPLTIQPPDVDDVANMLGIPRETVGNNSTGEQWHTALMDARWAYRVFREIVPSA